MVTLPNILNCPSWIPHHVLNAEHLSGLESFVLARHWFGDRSYGVFSIDFDLKSNTERVEVDIRQAIGVTPGGHPVVVDQRYPLGVKTYDYREAGEACVLIRLRVNYHGQRGESDRRVPQPKFGLEFLPFDDSHPPPQVDDCLDIGCFKHEGDGVWIPWRKPPVFRLLALKSRGEEQWQLWVHPLVKKLEELIAFIEGQSGPKLPIAALAAEIGVLTVTWPVLTVAQLVRSLSIANALLQPLPVPLDDLLVVDFSDAERLPQAMADILNIPVARTERTTTTAPTIEDRKVLAFDIDVTFSVVNPTSPLCVLRRKLSPGKLCLVVECAGSDVSVTVYSEKTPIDKMPLVVVQQPNNRVECRFELKRQFAKGERIRFKATGLPPGIENYSLFYEDWQ